MLGASQVISSISTTASATSDLKVQGPSSSTHQKVKTESVIVKTENNESAQTTCRVCLLEGNIPIYGDNRFNDVSQELSSFTGIDMKKNKAYPKHLCESCNSLLQGAIQLRVTALYSDQVLKQRIGTLGATEDSLKGLRDQECSPTKPGGSNSKYKCEEIDPEMYFSSEEDIKPLITRKATKKSNKNIHVMPDGTPERETKNVLGPKCKRKGSKNNNSKVKKVSTAPSKNKFYCKQCNVALETKLKYEEHKQSEEHKNYKETCPICGKEYGPLYFKKHLLFHHKQISHICDICGKDFIIKGHLIRHRKTHFLDLPFKCSLCPYRGRESYCLKLHMQSHREKTHQCPECLKLYSSRCNLRNHLLTHKTERDFQCDGCPRGFYRKPDLERHIKADHMGIKDHVCDICGKAFGLRKKMIQHKVKVHKIQKSRNGRMPLYLMADNEKSGSDINTSESTKQEN